MKKEPTFIEQAFAIIENRYKDNGADHKMTIADHKLLCQILNAHEDYIDDKIISKFIGQIGEHYDPIMTLLKRLEIGQKSIAEDITAIKNRIEELEDTVNDEEKRIRELERKTIIGKDWIERLDKKINILGAETIVQFSKDAKAINDTLEKTQVVLEKSIKYRSKQNIIIRASIAGVIITALWSVIHYIFFRGA
jgi:hypothetical protein